LNIALLMGLCEGEEAISWEVVSTAAMACSGAKISLFLVDDASPSHVGKRLAARFREEFGHDAQCHELAKPLRFFGTAVRLFQGLSDIASSDQSFDMVVKLEPDICVVRRDLLPFLKETCPDGIGMFGERYEMRARDSMLILADLVPFGFARKRVDDVIHREWRLRRLFPVWWADFGRRALLNGFRFGYIAGSFWILGGKTLRKMAESGWLTRSQTKHGFLFTDDVLLSIAAYATGDPVVDLATRSPHWGRFLSITEETPLESILPRRPYIIHHLKDRPKGWEGREQVKRAFGWDIAPEQSALAGTSRAVGK
jgi:hypothetical protein